MRLSIKIIAVAFAALATVAAAEQKASDPTVIARQGVMDEVVKHGKVLFGMAGGDVAFDAAAAEAAKAGLIAASAKVNAAFKTEASDPASAAKPEIWTNWADFEVKSKALSDAAGAADVTTLAGVQAAAGALGEACKGCHSVYRIKK